MKRRNTLEHCYPTRAAREAADEAIDALPDDTKISDAMVTWLRVYTEHGGAVRAREKGDPR